MTSLCQHPFIYNYITKKCEYYTLSDPDHCIPINNNILEYNANTKTCIFNRRDVTYDTISPIYGNCPSEYKLINGLCTKQIVNKIDKIESHPVCKPGTVQMPDKKCKSTSITQEPAQQPAQQTAQTNNTLIYILLFIFVIALGYFYTRKKNSNSFNR
jgi:hypothetical protein